MLGIPSYPVERVRVAPATLGGAGVAVVVLGPLCGLGCFCCGACVNASEKVYVAPSERREESAGVSMSARTSCMTT